MLPDGAACQHLSIDSPIEVWGQFDDDVEAVEAIIWHKRFTPDGLTPSQRTLLAHAYNQSDWHEQQLQAAGMKSGMNLGLELSRINTVPRRLGRKLQALGFEVMVYDPSA